MWLPKRGSLLSVGLTGGLFLRLPSWDPTKGLAYDDFNMGTLEKGLAAYCTTDCTTAKEE